MSSKPWRVLDEVVERDLPAIIAYHQLRSRRKAAAIVADYERIVALLQGHPQISRARSHGWRVSFFRVGVYALYYRELPDCWLIAGVFHAARDPDWIRSCCW